MKGALHLVAFLDDEDVPAFAARAPVHVVTLTHHAAYVLRTRGVASRHHTEIVPQRTWSENNEELDAALLPADAGARQRYDLARNFFVSEVNQHWFLASIVLGIVANERPSSCVLWTTSRYFENPARYAIVERTLDLVAVPWERGP